MKLDHPTIAVARDTAEKLRPLAPEMAAALDRFTDVAESNGEPVVPIRIDLAYQLDKFNGNPRPGDAPVETITGEG
jgi:hypothetical protein